MPTTRPDPTTSVSRPLRRRRPSQQRGADTIQALRQSTSRLLEKRDYRRISVAELAKKAGVGIGTFYHFYPSKEALLLDLRRDLFDETASDLTARFISVTLTDGESLIQALELLMQNLIAIAQRYRGLERAVASACLDNPGFAVEIRTQEMVVENLIREVLIANSRVLKPLDAGAAARSILILVEGVVARSMREPDLAKEPTKVVKEVARMLARYLLLPRGRLAS